MPSHDSSSIAGTGGFAIDQPKLPSRKPEQNREAQFFRREDNAFLCADCDQGRKRTVSLPHRRLAKV
jgi:hypothetical protein